MKRDEPEVSGGFEELISVLEPTDRRVLDFRASRDDEGASRFVRQILADGDLDIKATALALWLVPRIATPELIHGVVELIRKRPAIALMAGSKLGRLHDATTFAGLEDIILDTSLAYESRAGAAVALAELRDSKVIPVLIRALRTTLQEPVLASHIAMALGFVQLHTGSKDAAGDLCELLRSNSPDVRVAAINALGNMLAFEAVEAVEALRNDPGITTRGQSVGQRAQQVSEFLRRSSSQQPE